MRGATLATVLLLAGCGAPRYFDRGAVLPVVQDTLRAQATEAPSPGFEERLRGLQQLALDGLRRVSTPTDPSGAASPLGRGEFDVMHRRDDEASWWIADRTILSKDEMGHWRVADQGVLLRPHEARVLLIDDLGLHLSGRDPARVARSVMLILVDSRLMVVDLEAWTCFLVP
jgi:hypothetical protein